MEGGFIYLVYTEGRKQWNGREDEKSMIIRVPAVSMAGLQQQHHQQQYNRQTTSYTSNVLLLYIIIFSSPTIRS